MLVEIALLALTPRYPRPAIEDVDFLDGDDARGVRLQLDYLKPDRLLKGHGVQSSIVVFGSTRLVEPAAAKQKVKHLRDALSTSPKDSELQRRLVVAERILAKSHYYEIAREFSRLVGRAGGGPKLSFHTLLSPLRSIRSAVAR